jgi:hypothetical protein
VALERLNERPMKEEIRKKILEAIGTIPAAHMTDIVIKETIRCVLYEFLKEKGFQPIPAFRNPRYTEGPVDIVGMTGSQAVEIAFCSNPTVELDDIKRLERVLCEKKFVISFSRDSKKVKMSTFFLKPGVEHIHIFETGD